MVECVVYCDDEVVECVVVFYVVVLVLDVGYIFVLVLDGDVMEVCCLFDD